MTNTKPVVDMTVEEAAGVLYETYCTAVGGVAFNGDPLPAWAEFSTDQAKLKQSDGWREVAIRALEGSKRSE